MRSEVKLFQATQPDYTNQQLYSEPKHKHKQHKQPFIKEDRHKPYVTKYDIIRETEDTAWNYNPQVELYNSKTYVSGQSLISFRRRAGIGTCSVKQNQKTLQPPVIQWP